jgi:2-polyprenyl-6-methoxyphenol hydroxylase-like FAD-dependent oxidoreductase
MTSAIVVGASVAGLLTARVLSDVVDEVVVMERERLTDAPGPRGHVPQGRHLHLLLTAGLDLLVAWFPEIDDELERMGAVWVDGTRAWVYQAGGYRAQGDWGPAALSMTRPLLEHVVRRRIALLDNVKLADGVVVDRVMCPTGGCPGSWSTVSCIAATLSSTVPVGLRGSRTSSSRRGSWRRQSLG